MQYYKLKPNQKEILFDFYIQYIRNNLSEFITNGKLLIMYFTYGVKADNVTINSQRINLEVIITSSVNYKEELRDIVFDSKFAGLNFYYHKEMREQEKQILNDIKEQSRRSL